MTATRRVVHTACTLDCPDACSLAVTVEDTADGPRIVDVDAGPANPATDGWICAKVKRHASRVYAPERVRRPLVRVGPKGAGEFREATWAEALDLIAGRMAAALDRRGGDAIAAYTYNSSAARVERASMTEALFAAIGATVVDHTICAHTMGESWASVLGDMRSADPADVVHSRLVVIWGANPTVSNTHFPPLVQHAAKAGARVVVVDPRRTAMAARADLHLAVRPGTDVVLAMTVAHQWQRHGHVDHAFLAAHADADGVAAFLAAAEEWTPAAAEAVTGVPAADIVTLAEWWGTTRPAMLRIGWGLERNANGGAGCRAVLSLPVVGGHFGQPGSGVIGSVSTGAVRPRTRWPREALEGPARRHVPMHQIGHWLRPGTDDPTEVLFVQGANPAVMCPDQASVLAALAREDVFTVVHEQVLTDTTRYADVVLPATTSFEIEDVGGSYGSYMVQPVVQVVPPVGEARSNDATGLALAAAMGFQWQVPPPVAAATDAGPRRADVPARQFVDTFPGGAMGHGARLADPVQGAPSFVPLPQGPPLTLISPATSKLINSMFGEFQSPAPSITLNPEDASARGLAAGQQVRVRGALGEITVPLEVQAAVRPGVAVMAKGVWLREYPDGRGVNWLTPATGDPLGNGACFNDTLVDVHPL